MSEKGMQIREIETAFVVDGHRIRRDGDMWCMTDLWRASGSPGARRPAEWLRYDGAAFVQFLADSLDMGMAHIKKAEKKPGGGGDTWGHWQIALAYAKALSHAFHARVNEVYRAFMAGQLVPVTQSEAERELIRYTLRLEALNKSEYQSVWDLELKLELSRLRKIEWDGRGKEPQPLALAYGKTWRLILGDAVYDELKRRNPEPKDGSLHGQWLNDQRRDLFRRDDLVIALVLARRCTRWLEYETEMRSHFRRTPIQLRLLAPRERRRK